jgi:carboxylesterase type B
MPARVKSNIKAFGGDPSRVTIFGQSAGGMSVSIHLVAPSSFSLYEQAIVESNPMAINYRSVDDMVVATKFADHLGCGTPSNTSCLQSAPMDVMLHTQKITHPVDFDPLRTSTMLTWAPVIDGVILTDQPVNLLASGKFNKAAKVLIGNVRNETEGFIPDATIGNTLYDLLLNIVFSTNSSDVEHYYPPSGRRYSREEFVMLSTDWLFVCPTRYAALGASKHSPNVYLYQFVHHPYHDPQNAVKAQCGGTAVCHGAELGFVFHTTELANGTWGMCETNRDSVPSRASDCNHEWLNKMVCRSWRGGSLVSVDVVLAVVCNNG